MGGAGSSTHLVPPAHDLGHSSSIFTKEADLCFLETPRPPRRDQYEPGGWSPRPQWAIEGGISSILLLQ